MPYTVKLGLEHYTRIWSHLVVLCTGMYSVYHLVCLSLMCNAVVRKNGYAHYCEVECGNVLPGNMQHSLTTTVLLPIYKYQGMICSFPMVVAMTSKFPILHYLHVKKLSFQPVFKQY